MQDHAFHTEPRDRVSCNASISAKNPRTNSELFSPSEVYFHKEPL